jgi:anti-sigma factor RsiW
MITCRDVDEFLDDYLEGTLPEDKRKIFEAHLGLCPPCVSYIRDYRTAGTLAKHAQEHDDRSLDDLPDELVNAILAASPKPR